MRRVSDPLGEVALDPSGESRLVARLGLYLPSPKYFPSPKFRDIIDILVLVEAVQ